MIKRLKNLIFIILVLFLMMILVSSCIKPRLDLTEFYTAVNKDFTVDNKQDDVLLSFSARNCPLDVFSAFFSKSTGYSLVFSDKIKHSNLDLFINSENLENVAYFLSKSLDSQVVCRNHTFFIGDVQLSDNSYLVRRVDGVSVDSLNDLISVFVVDDLKAEITNDGIIFATGKQNALMNLNASIDDLLANKSQIFALQFFVLTKKFNNKSDLGFNLSALGNVNLILRRLSFTDSIHYLFSPSSDFSYLVGSLTSSPFFLVRDGSEVVFTDGISTPIPNRTVSDAGTVTTNGYTNTESGLKYIVKFRQDGNFCLLDVSVEDSHITDYVEFAPIVQKTLWKSNFRLDNNSINLIGSYDRQQINHGIGSLFAYLNDTSVISTRIFVRAYPVNDSLNMPSVIRDLTDDFNPRPPKNPFHNLLF